MPNVKRHMLPAAPCTLKCPVQTWDSQKGFQMKERANEDRLTSPSSPFQIYWVLDGVEVQPERDPNFLQAADGHLIVVQTRQSDRGNYTCVAENVANTRMSPAARLQVVGKLRAI